ncbi:4Fe-4S dicluster domain-containing protein [Geobacter sp. FeAm09]|uniref:heterodisulfide reductase-related iron-sulfur binding cluster n=1 Tax=Geobacter sp. FeAm09 TaxID=2597769 RepID=UPI0011EEC71C|nr:heterodisulfide reductase-related iron-sulfur binding cluster [Geobacter sp. FeAm09]QEM68601.1 4Fe-4S dicluster domain-containing protein [Geobacter sp. FeAm09]
MEASRQLLWNIDDRTFINMGGILVLASLLVGLAMRLVCWCRGGALQNAARSGKPLSATIRTIMTLKGIHLGSFPLLMHRCILYGFMLLLAGTLAASLELHGGLRFLRGTTYLLVSVTLDLAGVAFLAGILLAACKRYIIRSERLENHALDAAILAMLGLGVVSGFLVEGLRITATGDPWAPWSPAGYAVAAGLGTTISPVEARVLHKTIWYLHAALSFLMLAMIPWTKLSHMLALPLNIHFARPLSPRNTLLAVPQTLVRGTADLSASPLGALIEMDACTRCGRCRKQCPIHLGGIPFSPETLLQGLGRLFHSGRWTKPLIGGVIDTDALWSCTACRSCEERCPMAGEHVERFVGIRRSEIVHDRMPAPLAERFKKHGAIPVEPPQLPSAGDAPGTVYVWPGCRSAGKETDAVLDALLAIMNKAGVPFRVLAPPACCSGMDRILGNDALFHRAARANIEYLQPIKGATIVTPCPHCYNTLKNEYPALDGCFTLLHHSQFLKQLGEKGPRVTAKGTGITVTLHDPCFLGRYNSDYASSRELLCSLPGVSLIEMKHSRKKSFCCGSGGGSVVTASALANARQRVRQAASTGADLVVTSCPYCREILQRAVAESAAGDIRVADIAELYPQGEYV